MLVSYFTVLDPSADSGLFHLAVPYQPQYKQRQIDKQGVLRLTVGRCWQNWLHCNVNFEETARALRQEPSPDPGAFSHWRGQDGRRHESRVV